MHDLTKRQVEVLEAINKYIKDNHYAPAYRDLGKILGVKSPSTVSNFLYKLKKKGYVNWKDGQPRTLFIIEQKESSAN